MIVHIKGDIMNRASVCGLHDGYRKNLTCTIIPFPVYSRRRPSEKLFTKHYATCTCKDKNIVKLQDRYLPLFYSSSCAVPPHLHGCVDKFNINFTFVYVFS